MAPTRDVPTSTATASADGARSWAAARSVRRELALQDWIILAYCAALVAAVALGEPGEAQRDMLVRISALSAGSATAIFAVRAGLVRSRWLAPLVYRIGVFGAPLLSYFLLRELLPIASSRVLDAEIYAFDLRVFGFEPAVWFDRWVTPATTEWFAFFYFFYFLFLGGHIFTIAIAERRRRLLAEFTLGMILLYAVAQLLYIAVPGYGPVTHLATTFRNPLPEGTWLDAVLAAVNAHGALKDIFPSLHTGGPVFITLYAFLNRRHAPYRYTWPALAIFTVNIVIATMFLRWHYLIDVIAGATLATACVLFSRRYARRERDGRAEAGLQPVWTTFFSPIDGG